MMEEEAVAGGRDGGFLSRRFCLLGGRRSPGDISSHRLLMTTVSFKRWLAWTLSAAASPWRYSRGAPVLFCARASPRGGTAFVRPLSHADARCQQSYAQAIVKRRIGRMPRYFFNLDDHPDDPDLEGTVVPDLAAARTEALHYAGEIIAYAEPSC